MPMPKKDNNALEYFEFYADKEYVLNKQDIEENYKDLIRKSLDIKSYTKNNLLKRIPQDKLFANEFLLYSKKVRFGKQEQFFIDKTVSDINYHYLGFQNNNFF